MAEYVLAHQFRVATMTIDEFAAAVGVSVATANRLRGRWNCRATRSSAPSWRAVSRPRWNPWKAAHRAGAFGQRRADLRRHAGRRHPQRPAQPARIDAEACEQAVDIILGADRVFIIGFGASGFLAGMLQRGLCMHLHSVESLAGPGGVSHAARQMSRMTSKDLVIAIAFPRYLADTVTLANAAKQAGVPVLVLTDKPTSPLAPAASVVLYAVSTRQLIPNSETAALGLIEALSPWPIAPRFRRGRGRGDPVRDAVAHTWSR